MPARIALFTIVAALALAACGGGDEGGGEPRPGGAGPATQPKGGATSDEAAVRSTMVAYIGAVAEGDGAKACAQLTENGKRSAASARGAGGCEEAIDEIGAAFTPRDRQKLRALRHADIEVRIDGDTATAQFRGARTTKLARRGDRWLIDGYADQPRRQAQPDDDPAEDVKSVPFDRVEEKLKEALDRRYGMYRYQCPTAGEMRLNQKVDCEVTADGERGTAKLELVPGAFLRIRLNVGGRQAFSQSQVRPWAPEIAPAGLEPATSAL